MAGPDRFNGLRSSVLRPRVLIAVVAIGIAAAAAEYIVTQQTRVLPPLAAIGLSQRALQLGTLRIYAARGAQGSLLPQADAVIALNPTEPTGQSFM